MTRRDVGIPPAVVEVLRFCVVVFLAGVGFQISRWTAGSIEMRLGPFDADSVGIIVGAGLGYVVGGVVGRITGRSVAATEAVLSGRSAEQLLAGLVGSVLGMLVAGGLTWPLLLVGSALITIPVFVFICVTLASLGYRLGLARRAHVLALFGPHAGLRERPTALASLPRILDSSVAIDGRILDVVRAGFLHGVVLVPEPVLGELQGLADATDDLRRGRGRHGLEVIETLRREEAVELEVIGDEALEVPEVDAKLIRMAIRRQAALLTLDTNLAKVAALAGCRVMNLHALTLALRPPVRAGDSVTVHLTRAGKEAGQAVGYLDDGTMVVVERARDRVGADVSVQVTSVLTTANGRMVFGRLVHSAVPAPSTGRSGPHGIHDPAARLTR